MSSKLIDLFLRKILCMTFRLKNFKAIFKITFLQIHQFFLKHQIF